MSRIRADKLVNRAGSGGPQFPYGVANGLTVAGVVTATSFSGDGSSLTGIDASALKDGNNVKVQATPTGATVTGILVADVTGNLTGNVTGTATTATNASTLLPGATGADLTLSGNLTVNGTTTTIDTAVTSVDSLQIDGNVGIGTTNATSALDVRNGIIVKDQDTTQNSANPGLQLKHNGTIYGSWRHDGRLEIGGQDANATIRLNPNGTVGINSTTPAGALDVGGTISDSIGPLRRLGINNHNAATYTLVAGDAGKLVREATSAANITIPQNVFSAGDMISIFNVSTGDNTITQGTGTTLYNTADGATGNRTLAAKGVCTIVCTDTNEFIISGSQIS